MSAHALAHLIGEMTATMPTVFPVALHYRALQRLKNRILWKTKNNYLGVDALDKESRADLWWWISQLSVQNGRTLITPMVDLTIESDASTNLGCILPGTESKGALADNGKTSVYQFAGVKVSFPGTTDICINEGQSTHLDANRHQDRDNIYQSEGRNVLQNIIHKPVYLPQTKNLQLNPMKKTHPLLDQK